MPKFKGNEYTKESLEAMEVDALLELRNEVADSLGVAKLSSFKDKTAAVNQTLKALERADKAETSGEKGSKPKKEPKERGIPKSAEAKEIKRPTRNHFATIKKTGEHDGTGNHGRPNRWPNYKDGMTIAEVIETHGTEPWDVYNWQKHGIMDVIEPTDEQYAERRAAWYKAKGRKDPEVEKAEKKKAREEAAAKKKAEEAEAAKAE